MQNILNKLAKIEKAQPKKSKFTQAKPNRVAVKLSVIAEIENNEQRFENAYGDAVWLAYDYGDQLIKKIDEYRAEIGQLDDFVINGNVRDLEEVTGILENALNTLEEKANELGIDAEELYADFGNLVERVADARVNVLKDAEDKYKEVVEYSGVLNNFWK